MNKHKIKANVCVLQSAECLTDVSISARQEGQTVRVGAFPRATLGLVVVCIMTVDCCGGGGGYIA